MSAKEGADAGSVDFIVKNWVRRFNPTTCADDIPASKLPPPEGVENVFSDDETERKFIQDICWIKKDHWIHSEMKWNAIHGVEWQRKQMLGQGSFGKVYVGVRNDGKLFAVKSIFIEFPFNETTRYNMKAQINEIKMLRYLRSKYIVRFLGCGRSHGNNVIGPYRKDVEGLDVFMEFAPRGSLRTVYKDSKHTPFPEDPYIRQYTYDLLKALQYLQKKRVVHGDIKCENILLGDDCVKLTDFGGAKQLNATNYRKYLTGTLNYLAPEAIRKEKDQSYPSDIFSLGCTIIFMATGEQPERVAAQVMGHHHLHDPNKVKPVIMPKTVSFVCRDFLKQCLYQNPEDRWTAAELLHHPFIADRNKANKLPYQRKVAEEILANLLQPPRRLDPELPDEPITQRVDRHINGTNPSWPTRLAGCGSQRVVPPLPRANIAGSSKPLPPVSPGHKEDDFPVNYLGWIPKHNPPAGDPKSPRYLSPQNSEKLIVPTPVGSPEHVAADSTKIREAYDHMINSANAMREANEDILQSARAGSKEQDRSICEELFPQLGNSPPSPDRNGKTPMEEIYGTLYSVPL